MPSPAVDISTGITIVFGTSSFSAQIIDVTPPSASRGAINTSHQGTTGSHTFSPEDLTDPGECTFTIHFNPDTAIPAYLVSETITITFPSGATWAFSGFVTNYSAEAPLNDKMTGSLTVKVADDITITPAA